MKLISETDIQIFTDEVDFNEWFYYDESSVTFLRWNKTRYKKNGAVVYQAIKGSIAGVRTGDRIDVRLFYKLYKVHRIIYEIHYGKIPDGLVVDHIDGDFKNNNINNLRAVPQKVNTRNQSRRVTNRSGVTGVFRFVHKKSGPYWRAFWADPITGIEQRRDFSVSKYGEEAAMSLALELREAKLESLVNTANYTEDHGKRETCH